jgi:hypothetical protein
LEVDVDKLRSCCGGGDDGDVSWLACRRSELHLRKESSPLPLRATLPSTTRHCQALPTMPWPSPWPWSPTTKKPKDETHVSIEDDLPKGRDWNRTLTAFDWQHYTQPSAIVPSVLLTATTLFMVHLYRNYLRRIPDSSHIRPGFFRRRSLFGVVTRVGDGDNFRLFHTPGGRLAGWGWARRKVPTERKVLREKTVCAIASYG